MRDPSYFRICTGRKKEDHGFEGGAYIMIGDRIDWGVR